MIEQFYLTMARTLTGTTNTSQSGPGSNRSEAVLNISQSSRCGTSLSDVVLCHTQDTRGEWGSSLSAEEQSVYSTSSGGKAVVFRAPLSDTIRCSITDINY